MCNFALMINLFLAIQRISGNTEVLVWVAGIFLLLLSVIFLFYQRKVSEGLTAELAQLEGLQERNVEYEFVLRAMKVVVWHINCEERTIAYDTDYRSKSDSHVIWAGSSVDELLQVVAPTDRVRVTKALEDIMAGRSEEFNESCQIIPPHTGVAYWAEFHGTVASRNIEGLPDYIVGTSLRIDERKKMEQELIEARNKAEESDRLKSAFIANMSHEIRTPLNAIIGFTSVLPDLQGDEERKELIGLIQENNQKLLRIIDDVMSISKIESGKDPLVMSTFELNDTLRSVLDTYTPKLQDGVQGSTMFAQGAMSITTDLNRLLEVMNHLMANAVKFTSQGSVTIGYDAPENKRIRIWIHDTGKGIAPENHERVFERFFKVDEYIPGAGLGLSICRTMAYSMGGNVGVDSELGKGSTFWLELPV